MDKKVVYYLFGALIILGIIFGILSLNKDITSEEMDFVKAALAIKDSGHPIYYQAEQAPFAVALWHPPMYIYLLAQITKVSTNEIALRSLNFIAILITALLIYILCVKKIDKEKGQTIGIMASGFFLINFYVLSSALLIDIDALSTLFVFSFIFFTLMNYERKSIAYTLLSIFVFILALSNRYPIAIMVYSLIFIYILIKKEIRKYAPTYVLIGITAGIIFLVIWTVYSTFIQPGTFFSFIVHNANLGSEQFKSLTYYLASFSLNLAQIIRLFTLPALLLFILSLKYNLKQRNIFTKIILIYTLSIFTLFIIIPRPAFGYPRYFFTMMPGFFILISNWVYHHLTQIKIKKVHYIAGLLCFVASLILLILLDPQLTLYRNDGLIKATNLPDLFFNLMCSLPLILIFLFRKQERKVVAIILIVAIFFSYNLYFDGNYVTNDSHIKEVGLYVRANTLPSEIIIAPKAIEYYAERRAYANDYYKPPINQVSWFFIKQYISESYKSPKIDTVFFWGNDPYGGIYYSNYTQRDNDVISSAYLVLNYKLNRIYEQKIGDYYIYNLR